MFKSGKQWPIFIATAIMGVVTLGYWTIKETMKSDLSQSDMYLSKYQDVDENINDYLAKNIEFNKYYKAKVIAIDLDSDNGFIRYKIVTSSSAPVSDANVSLVLSRPIADAKDIKLTPSKIENGVYSFENIKLPKKGRWNLHFYVIIGKFEKFDNLKADTRSKEVYKVKEVSSF